VIAPNPVHDDRELARNRDFGASHANSFRQPQPPEARASRRRSTAAAS
jgi:hypothetical protein